MLWATLIFLSILIAGILQLAHLPAALLLGPMIGAIILATNGKNLRVPNFFYAFSQAVIGCLVARSLTSSIVTSFSHQWPLFLGAIAGTLVTSCTIGWMLSRFR